MSELIDIVLWAVAILGAAVLGAFYVGHRTYEYWNKRLGKLPTPPSQPPRRMYDPEPWPEPEIQSWRTHVALTSSCVAYPPHRPITMESRWRR
jgi:hypothetical protein